MHVQPNIGNRCQPLPQAQHSAMLLGCCSAPQQLTAFTSAAEPFSTAVLSLSPPGRLSRRCSHIVLVQGSNSQANPTLSSCPNLCTTP
jgi:hypothetical protein